MTQVMSLKIIFYWILSFVLPYFPKNWFIINKNSLVCQIRSNLNKIWFFRYLIEPISSLFYTLLYSLLFSPYCQLTLLRLFVVITHIRFFLHLWWDRRSEAYGVGIILVFASITTVHPMQSITLGEPLMKDAGQRKKKRSPIW